MSYTKMSPKSPILTDDEIEHFIESGFLRIDDAFPASLAAKARKRIWRDLPGRPDDPKTWTEPVVLRPVYWQKPFVEAANTPQLHVAFDALAGPGRWRRREALGAFVIRFPGEGDFAADWHVDASYPPRGFSGPVTADTDFSKWCVNLRSRGRLLLMLFLFSDVGEKDAPTRIRAGSHKDVARLLAPHGEKGLAGEMDLSTTAGRPEVLATGRAGTVYLCHPFLVHAGQPHRGNEPRFMAQPPLEPARGHRRLRVDRPNGFPIEEAIFRALHS